MFFLTSSIFGKLNRLSLLTIIISLLICSKFNFVNGSNRTFDEDSLFITPINQQHQRLGVQGIPYTISPYERQDLSLKYCNNNLTLDTMLSPHHVFTFSQHKDYQNRHNTTESKFFTIKSFVYDQNLGNKDVGFLFSHSSGNNLNFQIRFTNNGSDISRPDILVYDLNNYIAKIHANTKESDKSYFWILRPVHKFNDRSIKKIDSSSLLFMFPKKITLSELKLECPITSLQLQGFYDLHIDNNEQNKLIIVHENDDYIYASTPEFSYYKGLFINSGSFPLKIFNLKGFKIGKGDTQKVSKESAQSARIYGSEDPIELTKLGEYLYIEPPYNTINSHKDLPLLGDVEFKPGNAGMGYAKPSYDMAATISIKELIFSYNGRLMRNKFTVELNNNIITVTAINGNIATNPGNFLFGSQFVAKQIIEELGQQSYKTADRIAVSIESLGLNVEKTGKSIELASKNAERALIAVSEDFSNTLKFCFTSLNDTLIFATRTFDNAINILSLTAQGITQDIIATIPPILKHIQHVAKLLNDSLIETSNNLEGGAQVISAALITSARSFEAAFDDVSQALRSSSQSFERSMTDVSHTVKDLPAALSPVINKATDNFVEGMKQIQQAAQAMQSTHHTIKHKPRCNIS